MQLSVRTLLIELDFHIHTKKDVVWDAFVNDIGEWWRIDFSPTGTDKMVFEPFFDGKMYEDCGNGTRFICYTVESIIPNDSIFLSGEMDDNWGGPCRTLLSLKFEEDKRRAVLIVADSYIGHISEKAEGSFENGWNAIFSDTFKPYI